MKLRTSLMITALAMVSCLATAGEAVSADSLYERLGGAERVAAIADSTIAQLGSERDPQSRQDLVRRICAVTGGGCRYRGSSNTGAELVEALRIAMRSHGVPLAARNELLEALAPAPRDSLALNPRP
jgi:hypothetical protein